MQTVLKYHYLFLSLSHNLGNSTNWFQADLVICKFCTLMQNSSLIVFFSRSIYRDNLPPVSTFWSKYSVQTDSKYQYSVGGSDQFFFKLKHQSLVEANRFWFFYLWWIQTYFPIWMNISKDISIILRDRGPATPLPFAAGHGSNDPVFQQNHFPFALQAFHSSACRSHWK